MIAQQIKQARLTSGLTQSQLALKTGTSLSAIRSIEQGHRNPSIELLEKIAEVLNYRVEMVLCEK